MGLLINTNEKVPVKFGMTPDDPKEENTVYVKPKLNSKDRAFIERSLFRMPLPTDGETPDEIDFAYSPTEAREVNLTAAVVDWEGPIFEGIEYKPSIWSFVDQDENGWWMNLVNAKINELTRPQTEPPAKAKSSTNGKDSKN